MIWCPERRLGVTNGLYHNEWKVLKNTRQRVNTACYGFFDRVAVFLRSRFLIEILVTFACLADLCIQRLGEE